MESITKRFLKKLECTTRFYFCKVDEISRIAFHFGYKHKSRRNIKVFVFDSEKNTTYTKKDWKIYQKNLVKYRKQKFPKGTVFLK